MPEVSQRVLEVLVEEEDLVTLSLEEKVNLASLEAVEVLEEAEVLEERILQKNHQLKDLGDLEDELEIFLDPDSAFQML